jgi:endonuclease-3 related protein
MANFVLSQEELLEVYRHLLTEIGPRGWWPAESPFEVMVGVILTQNTAWKNVEKAIQNLKAERALNPEKIAELPLKQLEELVRPSGYFRQKARRLKDFVSYFLDCYGGDVQKMADQNPETLREELLSIRGIGPESADSILLYALEKPYFVIDAYTHRIFDRHEWKDGPVSYDAFQEYFHRNLPRDAALFNEFHALIDYVGHHFCRRNPLCEVCPLQPWLPSRGERSREPVENEQAKTGEQ